MIEKLLDEPYWPEIEKDIEEFAKLYNISSMEFTPQISPRLIEMFCEDYFYNWIVIPLEREFFQKPARFSLCDIPNQMRDEKRFVSLVQDYLPHFKYFWIKAIECGHVFKTYQASDNTLVFSRYDYQGDSFIEDKIKLMKSEMNIKNIFSLTREIVIYQIKSSQAFKELFND